MKFEIEKWNTKITFNIKWISITNCIECIRFAIFGDGIESNIAWKACLNECLKKTIDVVSEHLNLLLCLLFIVYCLYLPSLQSTSSPSDVWFISVQLYGGSGFPAAMMWNTHGSFCWPTALSAMHMLNRFNFKLNFIYAFRTKFNSISMKLFHRELALLKISFAGIIYVFTYSQLKYLIQIGFSVRKAHNSDQNWIFGSKQN